MMELFGEKIILFSINHLALDNTSFMLLVLSIICQILICESDELIFSRHESSNKSEKINKIIENR